jgi:hypothetical protein
MIRWLVMRTQLEPTTVMPAVRDRLSPASRPKAQRAQGSSTMGAAATIRMARPSPSRAPSPAAASPGSTK